MPGLPLKASKTCPLTSTESIGGLAPSRRPKTYGFRDSVRFNQARYLQKYIDIQNERKTMTAKLARYIRIARHHIHGIPLLEEDRIDQQKISAIEDLQTYVVRKIDISVRRELFVPANWYWDDAIGATVQFSVDGQSFLLAQKEEDGGLFHEVNGDKVLLAMLPDQDRKRFTDHLLVAIGDALERASLS
jgi:hypothetical protein